MIRVGRDISKRTVERLTGHRLPRVPRAANAAEAELARQMTEAGIAFWPQWKFHPERNWKLDFAIPWMIRDGKRSIAIDIDGGVHCIRKRFAGDIERSNALQLAGWLHLRFSPAMVRDGRALAVIKEALR